VILEPADDPRLVAGPLLAWAAFQYFRAHGAPYQAAMEEVNRIGEGCAEDLMNRAGGDATDHGSRSTTPVRARRRPNRGRWSS
jgi:hypothetical protein